MKGHIVAIITGLADLPDGERFGLDQAPVLEADLIRVSGATEKITGRQQFKTARSMQVGRNDAAQTLLGFLRPFEFERHHGDGDP